MTALEIIQEDPALDKLDWSSLSAHLDVFSPLFGVRDMQAEAVYMHPWLAGTFRSDSHAHSGILFSPGASPTQAADRARQPGASSAGRWLSLEPILFHGRQVGEIAYWEADRVQALIESMSERELQTTTTVAERILLSREKLETQRLELRDLVLSAMDAAWLQQIQTESLTNFKSATDVTAVRTTLFKSLREILKPSSLAIYYRDEGNIWKLVEHDGNPVWEPSDSIRDISSFAGGVASERHVHYEPDLRSIRSGKTFGGVGTVGAVLTIPSATDKDLHFIVQAFSEKTDAFHAIERRDAARAIAAAAELAVVDRRAQLIYTEKLVHLIHSAIQDPQESGTARQELFELGAKVALSVSGAFSSNIRIKDPGGKHLRFAYCAGEGWTDPIKRRLYPQDEESAGWWVAIHNKELYLQDVATPTDGHYLLLFERTKSLFALPIWQGTEVIAVLAVDFDSPHGLSEPARIRLRRLAGTIGETSNILTVIQQTHQNEARRRLLRVQDPSDVLREALALIVRGLKIKQAALYIGGLEPGPLHFEAAYPGQGELPETVNWKPAWIPSTAPGDICIREVISRSTSDGAMIPVLLRNVGRLIVQLGPCESGNMLTAEQETFALTLVHYMAKDFAAYLATRASERNLSNARLRELAQSARNLGLNDSARLILARAVVDCFASGGHLRVFDPDTKLLQLAATAGQGVRMTFPAREKGHGVSGKVFESGKASYVNDVEFHEEWISVRREFDAQGIRFSGVTKSAACLPLKNSSGRVFGTLLIRWETLQDLESNAQRQKELQRVAGELSNLLWPPFELSELRHSLKEKEEQNRAWRAVGTSFSASNKLATLLEKIGYHAINELNFESCSIHLPGKKANEWTLHWPSTKSGVEPSVAGNPLVALALEGRRPVLFSGLRTRHGRSQPSPLPERWDSYLAEFGDTVFGRHLSAIETMVCVPLYAGDSVVGIMILGSKSHVEMREENLLRLETLASYAALAIDHQMLRDETERRLRLAEPLALMGGMIGGFLHFFSNILVSLSTTAELMCNPSLGPEELYEKVTVLNQQIERLRRLQRDMRLYASARKSEFVAPTSIVDTIKSVLFYFHLNEESQRRVDISGVDPSVHLLCNPSELATAVQMIMQNASEAMPSGGELTIWTETVTLEGRPSLKISFRDTGIGMTSEQVATCLQPFVSAKQDSGGTGLGLAIVYGITRRYRGKVLIYSQLGVGTTVTIEFPLNTIEEPIPNER